MSRDESGRPAAPASANRAKQSSQRIKDNTSRGETEAMADQQQTTDRRDRILIVACRPDVAIKAKVDPRKAGGAARRAFIALEGADTDVATSKDQARLSRAGRRAFHKARPSLKRDEP